jgi:pyridoxal phosphate enzyme (YggS family)
MPVQDILVAINAGIKYIGENIVQEANEKFKLIKGIMEENQVEFHFIGHLQTNKVKIASEIFVSIDSIDSVKLAKKLNDSCCNLGKKMNCLIQVNIGEEESKHGISEANVKMLLDEIIKYPYLEIKGLFAIPPFFEEPEKVRPYFRQMRILRDNLKQAYPELALDELSMGMSHDYEVAIEEGATFVRIGQGIFGPRQSKK